MQKARISANFRNLDILDWEFEESDSAFMVHNACWYPAKIVPQIPAHLILNLSRIGETILDPFCGSGTTLIESLRHGRRCIGTDVNPIAVYISQAKCRFIGIERLEVVQKRIYDDFMKACMFLDNPERSWPESQVIELCRKLMEDPLNYIPNHEENSGWFHPSVLNKLAVLKSLIWQESPIIRDTLALAFFSILRECSSLPPRKPYTYIADNVKPRSEDLVLRDVLKIYREKTQRLLVGRKAYEDECLVVMKERSISVEEFNDWSRVERVDAKKLTQFISSPVDCVVTSPPYVGVTDTAAGHRFWYLWHDFGSTLEEDKINEIGPRWKRRSNLLLQEYIEDLFRSFQEATATLKKGGYFCLVIGEPERAKGKILSTITALMHERLHLGLCRSYRRKIHKKWFAHPTGGVVREDILVFQKI